MKTPHCKHCGSDRTTRKERKGFLEEVVMFKLGLFPWECNSCWKSFLSPARGKRSRRSSPGAGSSSPLGTKSA